MTSETVARWPPRIGLRPLGAALGTALGALVAVVSPLTTVRLRFEPEALTFSAGAALALGAAAGALAGWRCARACARDARAGGLAMALATYLLAVLLTPLALGAQWGTAPLALYLWAPVGLVAALPVALHVAVGAIAWAAALRFLAPRVVLARDFGAARATPIADPTMRIGVLVLIGVLWLVAGIVIAPISGLFVH